MKISTRTRYGTRLMLNLGLHYGKGPVLLKDIARAEEISEKYLSQIIIPLKGSGLLNSFRGANGGYILARPPKNITLKDIVEVLEGDFDLASCLKPHNQCPRASICVTRNLWADLGLKISNTLESVKLSDLINQCNEIEEYSISYNI